ncbi:MAG TPA: DUF4337 domain-containing protein [Xanthobacteraceae bacterium]|nr:DUF4337 domain-containing protein [Xanthobacteraceae bacterium]
MSEIQEAIEKAHEGEHAEFFNKRIALLIAVLALFLSFSETLGKGAQTEAISANVESSDLWAFFQAKSIRKTQVDTAAEEMKVAADVAGDPATKAAMQKQIDTWKQTAARYDSEPSTGEGRKELAERAKEAQDKRDLALAKYHHYELASAAFQVGIVLASAAVITGVIGLAWFGGALGAVGLALLLLGLFAPHAVPLLAAL